MRIVKLQKLFAQHVSTIYNLSAVNLLGIINWCNQCEIDLRINIVQMIRQTRRCHFLSNFNFS